MMEAIHCFRIEKKIFFLFQVIGLRDTKMGHLFECPPLVQLVSHQLSRFRGGQLEIAPYKTYVPTSNTLTWCFRGFPSNLRREGSITRTRRSSNSKMVSFIIIEPRNCCRQQCRQTGDSVRAVQRWYSGRQLVEISCYRQTSSGVAV